MDNKKLSDEQILQMISDFEALKEEEKAARLLGKGADKLVYDVPGQDMVLKIPNTTNPMMDTPLDKDYLYSKQLNKSVPVETPILVKRPDSSDVLLQKKLKTLTGPTSPSDEFYETAYNSFPNKDDFQAAIKAERQRVNNLPDNKAESDYYKAFDKAGLEDGDIHRGNLALDNSGNTKAIDVNKFWFGDHAPTGVDVEAKNNALHKMRETFSDKMDKLAKTRIFRSMVGALPLAGTAMALSSGDANAAMDELPSEIPGIGQVYDAVRAEQAGSAEDDKMMINEVNARNNYANSPAGLARKAALQGFTKK